MTAIAPKTPRILGYVAPQAQTVRPQVSPRSPKAVNRFRATPDSFQDSPAEEPSARHAVSKQNRAGRRELEATRKQIRESREDHDTDDV